MATVDEVISTASPISADVYGGEVSIPDDLTLPFPVAQRKSWIAIQVIPEGAGDFEVHLEAAIPSDSGEVFTATGEYTETDTLLGVFPPTVGVKYRFRHISGIACRVKIGG